MLGKFTVPSRHRVEIFKAILVDRNSLTFYLIETPFNTFVNRADPDQAALARAALSGSTL